MKPEPVVWLIVAGALTASWLAIPFALNVFDPLPADLPPNTFLGLGPPWLFVWLVINAVATMCFLLLLVMRQLVMVADYLWNRFSKNSN